MKFIASTTLAAILTIIACATAADRDVSKIQQAHQRVLSALSTRKSQPFGRHLVTDQCLDDQYEIDMTDINEQVMLLDEDFMGACDIEFDAGGIYLECDYGRAGPIIDSIECADIGGDVLLFDFEMECKGVHTYYYNIPQCIHSTCDAREYADFMAQDMEEYEWEYYGLQQCEIDFTFVDYADNVDYEEEYPDVEYDDGNDNDEEEYDDENDNDEEEYDDGEYDKDEEEYEDDEVEHEDDVSINDDFEVTDWEDDNLLVATAGAAPKGAEGDSSSATLLGDHSVGIFKVAMLGTYLIASLLL